MSNTYERSVDAGKHALQYALLDVDRLEQAREPGEEDIVHLVFVVEVHETRIHLLRLVVREERRGERTHPLAVPAIFAPE